jgi:hypothetical protein
MQGTQAPTMGHVVLHYNELADGPLAAKLLRMLGFHQNEPLNLDGMMYYHLIADRDSPRYDGSIYLFRLPQVLRDLQARMRQLLDVGGPNEDAAVTRFHRQEADDPEICFHIGLMYASLDALEEQVEAIQNDPELRDRIEITANKAPAGMDDEVDARLAASPVFSKTDRVTFGYHGGQIFISTDLLSGGPLGERFTIELDYVFPGHPENLFNKVVFTRPIEPA